MLKDRFDDFGSYFQPFLVLTLGSTIRITLNGQGFDVSTDRTVQLDSHITDFGNGQLVAYQLEARLFEGERVVQALSLKAWVSWFLTSFDTAKERFERQVYALLHILQNLGMNIFQRWFLGFPLREQFVGIVQAQRLTRLLVGILTSRQRIIIDPTAKLKHSIKACSLGIRWKKAVLKCQSHRCIVAYLRLLINSVKSFLLKQRPACTQAAPLHPHS